MIYSQENLFSRIDTGALYPPFLDKLKALSVNCRARGAVYYVTCGVRTYAEQDKLFAVGRTAGTKGHYLTKARGGQSLHNFAIAADHCRDFDLTAAGLQPDYKNEDYEILAQEAEKLKLTAGKRWTSTFPDPPHVQLPYKTKGLSLAMLNSTYRQGGYPAVFAIFDRYQW